MNDHFAVFELEPSVLLDVADLHARYLALQQTCHPDRFASAADKEKLRAIHKSAQINDAYQVLRDDVQRLRHLLALKGVVIDEAKTTQDMSLLMQQMAVRERLDEAVAAQDLGVVEQLQADNTKELNASLIAFAECFASMDNNTDKDTGKSTDSLEQATQILQKIQFLSKFKSSLNRAYKRIARS